MAETGAQVDVQPPPLFPAHRPSVKMAKNDDFRFRKKRSANFPMRRIIVSHARRIRTGRSGGQAE